MTARVKADKKVVAKKVVVDPTTPVHGEMGVFPIPREDGDAPVSKLKATDLHPVSMDAAMEKHGEPQEWVEPYPNHGLVRVMVAIETPIGREWKPAGSIVTIPAELAHSIHKQIKAVPHDA